MIILLLFLYSFCGYTINTALVDFKSKKPIMCAYDGSEPSIDTNIPPTAPDTIPSECEIIIFDDCNVTSSNIICNTEMLKKLVGLNRLVILSITRTFTEWSCLLKPDGDAKSAKDITTYANENGAKGVILFGISPRLITDTPDGTLAKNIVPYIKQFKCNPDFIVGISLDANSYGNHLTDSLVFNYEAMNELLDFYLVDTYEMNAPCQAGIFNGKSPIHAVGNYLSLDEVENEIKKTKIDVGKIYLNIDLEAADPNNPNFSPYTDVCTTKKDTSSWCIPTTKDYYDKANYIKSLNYGISVYWIELDDTNNSCACCPFIGFHNIVAGYTGKTQLSCPKFDIKGLTP